MSRAFKCDLCNLLFEPIPGAIKYIKELGKSVSVNVELKEYGLSGNREGVELDVCPFCMIKAMKYKIANLEKLLLPEQKVSKQKEKCELNTQPIKLTDPDLL